MFHPNPHRSILMRTLLAVQVTVVQGRVRNGALPPYDSQKALIDDYSRRRFDSNPHPGF
jgi:hypothetical protein